MIHLQEIHGNIGPLNLTNNLRYAFQPSDAHKLYFYIFYPINISFHSYILIKK